VRRKRGSTLIETLYSCVLLSLVTLFILNLYPGSFVAIKRGESTLEAEMYAQSILEDLKSRSYANLYTGLQAGTAPFYADIIYGGIDYSPAVSLVNYPGTGADAANPLILMGAIVTVNWTYKNVARNVTHEMFIANITR
jgi:hypothetical protein